MVRIGLLAVLLSVGVTAFCADEVLVNESNDGKQVAVAVGQDVRIELKSNATTGYSWTVAAPADKVLAETAKSEYVADANPGGLVGAGGKQVWHFKGAQAGTQTLKLEYRRPWEKNAAAAKTATFEFVVK